MRPCLWCVYVEVIFLLFPAIPRPNCKRGCRWPATTPPHLTHATDPRGPEGGGGPGGGGCAGGGGTREDVGPHPVRRGGGGGGAAAVRWRAPWIVVPVPPPAHALVCSYLPSTRKAAVVPGGPRRSPLRREVRRMPEGPACPRRRSLRSGVSPSLGMSSFSRQTPVFSKSPNHYDAPAAIASFQARFYFVLSLLYVFMYSCLHDDVAKMDVIISALISHCTKL